MLHLRSIDPATAYRANGDASIERRTGYVKMAIRRAGD